jgi:hypothetical protein
MKGRGWAIEAANFPRPITQDSVKRVRSEGRAEIEFRTELPKSTVGKILRKDLRKEEQEKNKKGERKWSEINVLN